MSTEKKELHVCMGLNHCANQGYSKDNKCAGMGDCATAVGHPCHTLNDCKGQGGCGIFGTTQEFCHPGLNDCKYQGSCGVPILNSRFIAQGPNKGRSVWILARKRFEEFREANGLSKPGQPPLPYGPTSEFVTKITGVTGTHASCGQSGDRNCSYDADPTQRAKDADARVLKMSQDSEKELPDSVSHCPTFKSKHD